MSIHCRVCQICKEDFLASNGYEPFCEEISIDFKCLMCGETNNVRHHIKDDIFSGETFECNACHNYIKYIDDDAQPYKDEFYHENFMIMNDFQAKQTYVSFPDRSKYDFLEFPLIEFSDKDRFINRIKSLIIFL